jgi:hypothetical protein
LLESYLEDLAISGDQEGFEDELEYHIIGGRIQSRLRHYNSGGIRESHESIGGSVD